MSPAAWAAWWGKVLADVPELDVIAHQDGVANHNSLQNATAFFAALSKVVKAADPPRQLWSDLEAFDMPALPAPAGVPYISEAVSPWSRISAQLSAERPFVDGFTVWEWHKYFSPLGGPQIAENPSVGPRSSTLNSNASLHNFIELLRRLAQDGAPVAPLRRVSLGASYAVSPVASASPGRLTDGLPYWNMGGALPDYQVSWLAAALETRSSEAPPASVRVTVELARSVEICSVKLFALRDTAAGIELPLNATVTIAGSVHTLHLTTRNDAAVNVMYILLPEHACSAAAAVALDLVPQRRSGIAVSEVEVWGRHDARYLPYVARPSPYFVPGLPHATLVELRVALIPYQDYHMLP